ncbi:hypothetical protein, partial [Liquorilactobacillus vini]|uniref:hypothetical protein n=1 Tax=Liquorilactobacillus vini TaxID=238015 RepID=UPI001F323349
CNWLHYVTDNIKKTVALRKKQYNNEICKEIEKKKGDFPNEEKLQKVRDVGIGSWLDFLAGSLW